MTMTLRKLYLTVLLAAVAGLLVTAAGGCMAMALETGSVAYNHLRGDLVGIVPDRLPEVYAATSAAMEELNGYSTIDSRLNTLTGQISGYDRQGRKLRIDLYRTEHDQTRVQVRIGWVGDKLESVMLYDQIRNRLPSRMVGAAQ